jgi:hypothetical protein
MLFAAIITISLILQCIAVYYFFRLISHTGHTRAWLLLSLGIATMAARRFIVFVTQFSVQTTHSVTDYSFEIIGVFGSAMMVAGVLLIKPVFSLIKNAEEEQRTLAESLKEALDNIKVMKELLPICSHCKKIRDDDGYWQQIETYISENSDTHFSHGICPDCCKKLYPTEYEKLFPREIVKIHEKYRPQKVR